MELLYQGPANVYLQGREALEVLDSHAENFIVYIIGTAKSAIRVIDFRGRSITAAHRALQGEGIWNFADIFNLPAWVEIRGDDQGCEAEIIMHEVEPGESRPTLWLGVLEGGWIPAQDSDWELLRPIDEERTAFASIIP